MVKLTPARNKDISARPDDLSDHAHRQLIGYIGLALPIVLYFVASIRGVPGNSRWDLLDSVSAYYYTGAVAVFVGLLVSLGLFLFSYRGYGNVHNRYDRLIAITAGFAALGVALFPTKASDEIPSPPWWEPSTGWLHYGSAVVLFACFATFCLWLFRLSAPGETMDDEKRVRNRLYAGCGLAIVIGMAWAALNGKNHKPIFIPESVCIVAFALSWLTKGRAARTLKRKARRLMKRKADGLHESTAERQLAEGRG